MHKNITKKLPKMNTLQNILYFVWIFILFEPIWTSNVNKNVLLYTEDGLKESRNVCKYR